MKPCIALHCLVAALAVGQFATASPEPVWKQVYAAAGSFHECPIRKDAASCAKGKPLVNMLWWAFHDPSAAKTATVDVTVN